MANRLKEFFTYLRVGKRPDDLEELPITKREDDIVTQIDESEIQQVGQFNQFRQLANDRTTLYDAYDEMKTDSVIAAALEMYADDATTTDEQGRVIWAESEDENIAKAANRLIDIFELPERAWKHIYQACLYGDYYLKVYRNENEDRDLAQDERGQVKGQQIRVINDVTEYHGHNEILNYEEYVEDVDDPATIFDLKLKGKTAGYIEVDREVLQNNAANLMTSLMPNSMFVFQLKDKDIDIYRPDRFVHIMIGENTTRNPETIDVEYGDDYKVTYKSARGKSILQDVYPIQKEIQLLEDTLLVNRLTRSPLIRLLEVELGDMPKKEVNNYLRRIKQLIEQHVSLDKDTGMYRSFNAPGPIDNVIYIPVRNGKGSVSVNNLGGDVNIRDIADIDYFNNKRAGALKIPRAYLGEDMDGSGLSNGGSLTRLSIRYARTIKRIQQAYIRAITTLINLYFVDKKLDYVNKFQVRMTSPSTQEDLERNELINGNIDLVSNIMDLTSSLEGDTQKKILNYLVANVMKMPDIAEMIDKDGTPEEDINIEGGGGSGGAPDIDIDMGGGGDTADMSDAFEETGEESGEEDVEGTEGGFTDEDYASFEDELPNI